MRAYGATTFVHIPPKTRPSGHKFNVRAQKGFLVGYIDGLNYRIWILAKNSIIHSTFIYFNETYEYNDKSDDIPLLIEDVDSHEEEVCLSLPENIPQMTLPTSPTIMASDLLSIKSSAPALPLT